MIFPIEAPPVEVGSVGSETSGADSAVLLAADRRALFTAEVNEATQARVGQKLTLAVDPARLHLFSPTTGEALLSAD